MPGSRTKNHKGAVADFEQAVSTRPKYTAAYIGRADAKVGLGQFQKAVADNDQTVCLEPEMPHLYLNRSLAKAGFGQHTETRADLSSRSGICAGGW